jgi:pectin methylesterase-like acyl-CoA thioesterase
MYPLSGSRLAITLGFFALFTACKSQPAKKITCTSTLHAYTASLPVMDTPITCTHGLVNMSTGAITSSGTFLTSFDFTNQAAFNRSDDCYYVFKTICSGIGCASV